MRIKELSEKQKEFLKTVFSVNELPEESELGGFISQKGCKLMECVSCGKLIFHDDYEFWNLTDCCDDNSKITERGLLCEVCYSRSPENLRHWIMFKPTWYKNVEFEERKGNAED